MRNNYGYGESAHLFVRLAHIAPPAEVTWIVGVINYELLTSWFEPLALRLNLARSMAWLGVLVLGAVVFERFHSQWNLPACWLVRAVLWVPVLCGWRSRPWLCLPATALTYGVVILRGHLPGLNSPAPWLNVAVALPLATILLYGTRLLRPEERARR